MGDRGGALLNFPDDMPPEQELELVLRLKQGDRAAAALLYGWYGEKLYRQVILPRLPVRELAEDVLKDTFRLLLEKIDQFNTQERSIFAWLRRIAINRATDVYRARQRFRHMEEALIHQEAHSTLVSETPISPDVQFEEAEAQVLIESALALINPRYAAALRLRLLEEREREECAEELGIALNTFDVLFHRACKAFREVYNPCPLTLDPVSRELP